MAKSAVRWVQSHLDAITRDRDIALRIMWAPDCFKTTLDAQGNPVRTLPKYPGKDGKPVELWVVEQKLPDALARRDHARSRFVTVDADTLSQCGGCDYEWAREEEEQVCPKCGARFIATQPEHNVDKLVGLRTRVTGGRRLDALGDFPKEGIWVWFYSMAWHYKPKSSDIARASDLSSLTLSKALRECREKPLDLVVKEFDTRNRVRAWSPDNACCKTARELTGEMCQGEYREPDYTDLAYLEECVRVYDVAALDRNPDDPYGVDDLHKQTQAWIAAAAEEEAEEEEALRERLAEALTTGLRSQPNDLAWTHPIFDMGGATKRGNQ